MSEDADRKFEVKKKVDSDWKRKVQMEKEKLAAQVAGATPKAEPAKPSSPKAEAPKEKPAPMSMGVVALVQQLADQAALCLGLVPGYERNCEQAAMAIEMLRALQEKTKGNLSAEEAKALSTVVYELQMRYVQACGSGGA